jgi:hypothetical protein
MKALEHRTTELLFEKGLLEIRKAIELDGLPFPKKPQLWVTGQKPTPQGGPFKPQLHITGRIDSYGFSIRIFHSYTPQNTHYLLNP